MALLLVVLGTFCGPAAAAERPAAPVRAVPAAAPASGPAAAEPVAADAAAVPADSAGVDASGVSAGPFPQALARDSAGRQAPPGCGQRDVQDLGQRPLAPRPGPSYELLPAPYDVRAVSGDWGAWGAEQALLAAARVLRAPPPVAPPSPVGLSVLRV
ncbi:hypothetical protein GCM10018785_22070 [Streptomyces longispororuber]|uniref:Uncharacterized protein n=1 Tax=Streptomyces longispororuber TaxID=68230 RepID=A0A918ZGN4_9ACTN|nr:hypothetical protein GCM10018785_22070 [Streptomyces longispororuber]